MKHLNQNSQVSWELASADGARILKVDGTSPAVTLPPQLAGHPVTELGDYCFADAGRHQEQHGQSPFTLSAKLCGSYIESVSLPDTLLKIGNYAFYNCRNLSQLEFGSSLEAIGSDAFMNCHNLHRLSVRCLPSGRSGLRQILRQIPWDVEVSFLGNAPRNGAWRGGQAEAVIFYPEYYEAYDEIAPAHIFGCKIVGGGFRARQCFQDGAVDFAQYDTVFQKACAEESEQTLCRLTLCRLRYPVSLALGARQLYEDYIRAHGKTLCKQLIGARQLDTLLFLIKERLFSLQDMQLAITLAAQAGWGEGSASLLRAKQLYCQAGTPKYEFEDF